MNEIISTAIIGVIVLIFVLLAVRSIINKKKEGGCCGGCAGCSGSCSKQHTHDIK